MNKQNNNYKYTLNNGEVIDLIDPLNSFLMIIHDKLDHQFIRDELFEEVYEYMHNVIYKNFHQLINNKWKELYEYIDTIIHTASTGNLFQDIEIKIERDENNHICVIKDCHVHSTCNRYVITSIEAFNNMISPVNAFKYSTEPNTCNSIILIKIIVEAYLECVNYYNWLTRDLL